MKVIIDTNIVVSATIADKNPEAVILFVISNSAFECHILIMQCLTNPNNK